MLAETQKLDLRSVPARTALKLRLYVLEHTFEAKAAVAQVQSFLQKHGTTYSLEILDVHENRELAIVDEIPFTPMLLRLSPAPLLRISMPAQNLTQLETALLGGFGPMVDSTPVSERSAA